MTSSPPCVQFDLKLLEGADPRFMVYEGDQVTIKAANGEATYQLGPAQNTFADWIQPVCRVGRLVEVVG